MRITKDTGPVLSLGFVPALAAAILLTATTTYASTRLGEVVFRTDFEAADGLSQWEGAGQPSIRLQQRSPTSKCLYVERPATAGPGSNSVRTRLPLEKLLGTRVRVEAMVKAENVAEPPNPWNGVKVMLHTVAPDGKHWAQQAQCAGLKACFSRRVIRV